MNLEQYKTLWDAEAKTPEGTVRLYLLAILEHFKEQNPEGKKMIALGLPKDEIDASGEPGDGQRLALSQFGRQIQGTQFEGAIAASYLGGTPQNGYAHDPNARLQINEPLSHRADRDAKLFIQSAGKDSPSPVSLKRNAEGHWKIFDASSLFTGVRPAESDDF